MLAAFGQVTCLWTLVRQRVEEELTGREAREARDSHSRDRYGRYRCQLWADRSRKSSSQPSLFYTGIHAS